MRSSSACSSLASWIASLFTGVENGELGVSREVDSPHNNPLRHRVHKSLNHSRSAGVLQFLQDRSRDEYLLKQDWQELLDSRSELGSSEERYRRQRRSLST